MARPFPRNRRAILALMIYASGHNIQPMNTLANKKHAAALKAWDDSGLIRKRDVLTHFISVSRATFDRWVATGYFPSGEVVGRRIRVWRVKQVKAWLDGNRVMKRRGQ